MKIAIRETEIKSKKDNKTYTAYEIYHVKSNEVIKTLFLNYEEQRLLRILEKIK